jgi:hypothetical protein
VFVRAPAVAPRSVGARQQSRKRMGLEAKSHPHAYVTAS